MGRGSSKKRAARTDRRQQRNTSAVRTITVFFQEGSMELESQPSAPCPEKYAVRQSARTKEAGQETDKSREKKDKSHE